MIWRAISSSVAPARSLLLAWVLFGAAGCHRYLKNHPVFSASTDETLHTIDSVAPQNVSVKPPVELPEANNPPATPARPPENGAVHEAAWRNPFGAPRVPAELPPEKLPELPAPTPLGEPQWSLRLDDARATALSNNLDLQFERVNPLIALAQVSAEEAKFQALFRASYDFTGEDPPRSVLNPAPLQTTQDTFNLNVVKPLMTGGLFQFGQQIIHTDVNVEGFPANYDTNIGFSFLQPLARGAGVAVNTAPIQLARLNSRQVDAEVKLVAIQVLADVEKAYWRLLAARGLLEIARQQYRLAEEQVNAITQLTEQQIVTRIDLERARSDQFLREDLVKQAELNFRLAQRDLKRVMQRPELPVDTDVEVIPATPPRPLGLTLDRQLLAQQGLQNRMELFQLEVRLFADMININLARNARLPRADLVLGRYRWLGAGTTLGRALEVQFEHKFDSIMVGLVAETPIGPNQAARAQLEQALQRRFEDTIDGQRIHVRILQDVYNAADQVELDWQRILAARQARISSDRAYQGAAQRYPAAGTLTDVLLTRASLGDAQGREVQAVAEYQIALVDLAVATGTMLGYGRVEWAPLAGAHCLPLPPRR